MHLVNLISNDASGAGVMAQCPYGTDFQLNVFSCIFQIQFLNQQLCAKTPRKQETPPISPNFVQNIPFQVSAFHSQLR